MENKLLLLSAKRWHGQDEEEGMHTVTAFFVVRNGQRQFLKSAHETLDEEGNKKLLVALRSLDCGHSVDDPKEAVAIGSHVYCQRCSLRCPSCGGLIVPGQGEQVEQVWYHKSCAASPREHFELKRSLEEGFLAVRLDGAKLQGQLVQAQIDTTRANVDIQKERLALETKREKLQRRLIAAQTFAVRENLRLAEKRLSIDEMQARERIYLEQQALDLQLQRLSLEEMHGRQKLELEERSLAQRERTLESQLESEALQRAINDGRFTLEWAERVAGLEEKGYLPQGSSKKALP